MMNMKDEDNMMGGSEFCFDGLRCGLVFMDGGCLNTNDNVLKKVISVSRNDGKNEFNEQSDSGYLELQRQLRLLGGPNRHIVREIRCLGSYYNQKGEGESAKRLFYESYVLEQEVLRNESLQEALDDVERMNRCGIAYCSNEEYSQAIVCFKRAVYFWPWMDSEDIIKVKAQAYSLLADAYSKNEEHVMAKYAYMECLALRRMVLPEYHSDIINIMNNLADELSHPHLGEDNVATYLRRQALEILQPEGRSNI